MIFFFLVYVKSEALILVEMKCSAMDILNLKQLLAI